MKLEILNYLIKNKERDNNIFPFVVVIEYIDNIVFFKKSLTLKAFNEFFYLINEFFYLINEFFYLINEFFYLINEFFYFRTRYLEPDILKILY